LFFAGKISILFQSESLLEIVKLFFAFSFAASSIYIINDLKDVEADRLHPEKRFRPIASGKISVLQAKICFIISILILASISCFLAQEVFYFIAAYFSLNLLYTYYLKNIAIVDVSCISLGFVLRILAGGAALGLFVSHWMIIIVFLLSTSIAFAKRRDDLIIQKDGERIFRKSQKGYTLAFIDVATSVSFSVTLISYIIYSVSEDAISRIGSNKLYITSLFVFLGILRYLQISIVEEKSGSPTKVLQKDLFLQIVILLWIATFAFIIYGKSI
ncbi:MAG TPA: UbiA prenyltransferase family protein, partial [Chitinophagales bacterium]